MRKNNLFLIGIMFILLSTSCVSTRTASTLKRAEKRVIKHNTGIMNQIERYPELIDKAYKVIEEKEILIPGDSVKINILLQNIQFLDSLNKKHYFNNKYIEAKLDSMLNIVMDTTSNLNDNRPFIKSLLYRIHILNEENKKLFDKYTLECSKDIEGTYQDSVFVVDYKFTAGLMNLDIKVKDRYQIVEFEKYNFDIKIRKNFWQDIKFWGFMIIVFNMMYFFGGLFKPFIDKVIKFIRKLIIKV